MFALKIEGSYTAVQRALSQAKLKEEWAVPAVNEKTQLREGEDFLWLCSTSLGAIRFNRSHTQISAFPKKGCDPERFEQVLIREWLPLIYTAWGYQVLHASAAAHLPTGKVVAFSGEAGAGKSTLGFGLGRRPDWQQIADEGMAMQVEQDRLRLVHIPNLVRLRPTSAAYYHHEPCYPVQLGWPDGELCLDRVYFLEPFSEGKKGSQEVQVIQIDGAEAYPLFLKQAFTLTLKLADQNQQLMQDYLALALQVKAYRLPYSKSFLVLDEILDAIEHQAGTL